MPNRIIKESIRSSKTVNAMSDFQFRLWTYLITYVDDFGRGSADPELLKGFVMPRRKGVTESTIEKTLAELATIGSIHLYEVDGESYLCFPNWGEHQRIQQKKSKFPEPPAFNSGTQKSTVAHGESPPKSNPIQSEYKSESESEAENAREATAVVCDAEKPDFGTLEAYASSNLTVLSPRNMEDLLAFREELDEDVIRHAIDEACAAGRRSWSYARAILRRFLEQGLKTMGDVKAAEDKRSAGGKNSAAKGFQQHSYTEKDFGTGFFYDPTADYGK